ncbi:divergent polysaccharide deacetylase family protein [Caenispirillum bisanense]|uniref:Divergent polysaccharide deacetylase n=1 Tax=Caenispirillum bisanense TaxID=414052 RepID=A0A286GEZ3_9PROT|nr:divergent polysaccharide deacetylase family protein [Caenispirillum bisanense]SOD94087.1 hypothetical protein SAMN05421508_103348 [Caenispirillum bisanense]
MADTPRSRSSSRSATASAAGGGSRSSKGTGTRRAAAKPAAGKGTKTTAGKPRRSSGGGSRTGAKRRGGKGGGTAGRMPGLSLRTLVLTAVAVALVVVGAAIGVSIDKTLREEERAEAAARLAEERAAAPRPAPKVTAPSAVTPAPAEPTPAPAAAPAPVEASTPAVTSTEALDYAHANSGFTEVPPAHSPAVSPPAVVTPRTKPPVPAAAPAPETQVAALPVPPRAVFQPAPKAFDGEAPWVKYAVPSPAANGRPMIAIVIDDLGVDKAGAKKIVSLPGPLTTAWMTYADNVRAQAKAARAAGHELIIHMPMEPLNGAIDSGPDVLKTSMTPEQVRARVRHGFEQFDGYVGINNHMGSKFTADSEGMRVVIDELRSRGLLWLDSKTSPKSVGARLAEQAGIPFAERHIFLDNTETVSAILHQLAETEKVARKVGYAIAIGHPHDATYRALKQWLPTLEDKGLVLVPLSAIVRKRMGQG